MIGNTTPLVEHSIGRELDLAAQERPDHILVTDCQQQVSLTYSEVRKKAYALANALLALGMHRGDRVGVWLANRWEYVVCQLGTALAGIVMVTINPAYRGDELGHAARMVGLRGMIMQSELKSSNYHEILHSAGNIPTLEHVIQVGNDPLHRFCLSFNDLLSKHSSLPDGLAMVTGEEATNIQFTSGTTGRPKGAVLSHRNLLNNARDFAANILLVSDDVLVLPLPLYHCFGLVLGSLAVVVQRATLVLPSESFDAVKSLDAISSCRGSILYGVPTMLLAIHTAYKENESNWDLSSLRGGAMGGSPCPPPLMEKMIQDMNMNAFCVAYGMTETSPVSFSCSPNDAVSIRCTTVGRVLNNVEAKVVDESGHVVALDSVGELLVKGDNTH